MPKFTLVLDSSQIAEFLQCPQRWHLKHVKRLVPARFDEDPEDVTAMNAGTYGHKLLEIYYRNKEHCELNAVVNLMEKYNPDIHECECGCFVNEHKEIGFGLQECSRCRRCAKFRAKHFALDETVRAQVRKRLVDYICHWQSNDFKLRTPDHTEIGFSFPLYEDSENLFVLEGRIDLMYALLKGQECLVDHKFQMSTHWLFPRSVQFKTYAMVTKSNLLVINYVRLGKYMKDHFLHRELVSFTPIQHLAWKQRLIKVFFDVKRNLLSPEGPERRWDSCAGKFKSFDREKNHFCWYTDICESSSKWEENAKTNALYKIRETAWKPW